MQPGSSPAPGGRGKRLKSLTTLCLGGLAVGVAAGLLLDATSPPWSGTLLGGMEALIRAWTNAFRLIVTPLIITQFYTAIASGRFTSRAAGRLSVAVPVVFLGLLLTAAFLTITVGRWALSLPLFAGMDLGSPLSSLPSIVPSVSAPAAEWVDSLVPTNLIGAAGSDKILPLMIFALVFALAARRIAEPLKQTLDAGAVAVRDALFVVVEWLLLPAPLVMLALGTTAAAANGLRVGGGLLGFALLTIVLLLLSVGLLYPLTALLGRVSIRRFAQAALPGQLAALATRSSLATIPLLLRGARETLELPPVAAATVLPLAGTMLKLSAAVVDSTRLVFLAHVLGVPIGPGDLAVFLVTILLISPSVAGVPTVNYPGTTLPAFLAVGIPPGYVVLLGTTIALTDPFETLLNTTSYLSASVLVARFGRWPADPPAPGQIEAVLP